MIAKFAIARNILTVYTIAVSRIRTTKDSFKYAFEGFKLAVREEPNFQLHVVVASVVIVLGLVLQLRTYEWILVFYAIFFVMILELFNTSIEAIVDLVSPEIQKKAKVAKDVAAAAVLLAAVQAVIIGAFVFIPHIFNL